MTSGQKGIRAGTRIPVELPVRIRWKTPGGNECSSQGKTESMSGNGVFILAPVRLRRDTPIRLTVALPAELIQAPMLLQCEGRVIRQGGRGLSAGLGVVIDDYRLAATKRLA